MPNVETRASKEIRSIPKSGFLHIRCLHCAFKVEGIISSTVDHIATTLIIESERHANLTQHTLSVHALEIFDLAPL